MKTIEEITQEIESKKKEFASQKNSSADKQEFFNGIAELLTQISDYLVEELKHDNKVEVTNFPAPVTEVKVNNFRGIFGILESISKTIKKFKLPDIFKVQGEVTVKNQVSIPEVKFPDPVKTVGVNALPGYVKESLDKLVKKDLKVEVQAPDVKVNVPQTKVEIDLSTLEELIRTNNELLQALDKPQQEIDLSAVEDAAHKTTEAIQALRFPVPNIQSSFQHSIDMQAKDAGITTYLDASEDPDYQISVIKGQTYRRELTMGSPIIVGPWTKQ